MKKVFLLTALLMAVMVSCVKEDVTVDNPIDTGENIPMSVSFTFEEISTYAMHRPGSEDKSPIETKIESIAVVAALGTADDSTIKEYTLEPAGEGKYTAMLPGDLFTGDNLDKCKLYFIANTDLIANFETLTTFGQLRSAAFADATETGIDKYVMASKSVDFEVKNGTVNVHNAVLYPTVSRLKIKYQSQSTPIEKLTISGTAKSGNLSEFLTPSKSGPASEELPFKDANLDFDYTNNKDGVGYYYLYPDPAPGKSVSITIKLKDVPEPRTLFIDDMKRGASYTITVSYKNQVVMGYNDVTLNYDPDTNIFTHSADEVTEQMILHEGCSYTASSPSWLTVKSVPSARAASSKTTLMLTASANTSSSDRTAVIEVTDIFSKKETITFTQLSPASVGYVRIPAGAFYMGSPESEAARDSDETQHKVTLSTSFQITKTEITNEHYCRFLNEKKVAADGRLNGELLISGSKDLQYAGGTWTVVAGKENYPVVYVSWLGASRFAEWEGGSLPTEAQWEYACRGEYSNKSTEKNTTAFHFGGALQPAQCNFAWKYGYSNGETDGSGANSTGTTPVGSYDKAANSYGLYDMHGNVWEWCSDVYDEKYGSANAADPATDPTGGASGGTVRVLKGGSWYFFARTCRSAYRMRVDQTTVSSNIGFRIVR